MHALLHRLCQANVVVLRNSLHEPLWWTRAAALEKRIEATIQQKDWASHFAAELAEASRGAAERLLILASSTVQVLDRYHNERQREVSGTVIALPAELGGGRTLFLLPPERPIEALAPARRRLGRGAGDLQHDLRSILSLRWHLVFLDQYSVQPEQVRLPAWLSAELQGRLDAVSKGGDLRIATASPFVELDYIVRTDATRCHAADGVPYRFMEVASQHVEGARRDLERIIEACAREKIDILCFPELTLDTDSVLHLAHLLKVRNNALYPLLIVAGSFHLSGEVGWVNRCKVLDGYGNPVFFQDKCVPYRMPGEQVVRLSESLQAQLGLDHRGGYEDIQASASLRLIDTPLGRLATPICLDFCGTELSKSLVEMQVNLLLVPAMSPKIGRFYRQAHELGTQARAMTVVANSVWLLRRLGLRSRRQRSLMYLPVKKGLRGGGREVSGSLSVFSIREALGLPPL